MGSVQGLAMDLGLGSDGLDIPGQSVRVSECLLTSPPAEGAEGAPAPLERAAPRQRLRGRFTGHLMPDYIRAKIQTSAVITRLTKIALGKIEGHPAQLMAQVAAGKVILDRSLPVLQAVRVVTDGDDVQVIITRME